MTRTIRQATVEDAPLLARAQREIARTPGLLASRPHEIADGKVAAKIAELSGSEAGRFLVVEDEGALVAHGLLDPLQLEVTRHAVALTIAVHPGSQGRGIGRELLSALITWARQAPRIEKVELRVRSGNDRALGLYRALGFVEEGRLVKRIKLGPTRYLDDISMGLWIGA
jgi:putative acetyltransferase